MHHTQAGTTAATRNTSGAASGTGQSRLVADAIADLWSAVPLLPPSALVQALLPPLPWLDASTMARQDDTVGGPVRDVRNNTGPTRRAPMDLTATAMNTVLTPGNATSLAPEGGDSSRPRGPPGADDRFVAVSGAGLVSAIATDALREVMRMLREACSCRELAECTMSVMGAATQGPVGSEGPLLLATLASLLAAQASGALRQRRDLEPSMQALLGCMRAVLAAGTASGQASSDGQWSLGGSTLDPLASEGISPAGQTRSQLLTSGTSTGPGAVSPPPSTPLLPSLRRALQLELLMALLRGTGAHGGLLPRQPVAADLVRGPSGDLWLTLFAFLSSTLADNGWRRAPPLLRFQPPASGGMEGTIGSTCLASSLASAELPSRSCVSVTIGDLVAELLAVAEVDAVARCLRELDHRLASQTITSRELSLLLLEDGAETDDASASGFVMASDRTNDEDDAVREDFHVRQVAPNANKLSSLLLSVRSPAPGFTPGIRGPSDITELFRACIRHRRQLQDVGLLFTQLDGWASDHAAWAAQLGRRKGELATVTLAELQSPTYWEELETTGILAAATRLRQQHVYSCFTFMQLWKGMMQEVRAKPEDDRPLLDGTGEAPAEGEGAGEAAGGSTSVASSCVFSLEECVDLVATAEETFTTLWLRLVNDTDSVSVADALLLWGGRQGLSLPELGHLVSVDLDKELAVLPLLLPSLTTHELARVRQHLSLFLHILATTQKAQALVRLSQLFLGAGAIGEGSSVTDGSALEPVSADASRYLGREDASLQVAVCLLGHVSDTSLMLLSVTSMASEVEGVVAQFSDLGWAVVATLACAGELLPLLAQLQEVDVRKLLDAVEEHSTGCRGQAREMSVRALIIVKSFMQPLMLAFVNGSGGNGPNGGAMSSTLAAEGRRRALGVRSTDASSATSRDLAGLLDALVDRIKETCGADDSKTAALANNIRLCCDEVHSLRHLFASLASRRQLVRDVALQAATCSQYEFFMGEEARPGLRTEADVEGLSLSDGGGQVASATGNSGGGFSSAHFCSFLMHLPAGARSGGAEPGQSFREAELLDYRSRSLLIINSVTSAEERKQALLGDGVAATGAGRGAGKKGAQSAAGLTRAINDDSDYVTAERAGAEGGGDSPTKVAAAMRALVADVTCACSIAERISQLAGLGHVAYQPPYRSLRVGGGKPLEELSTRVAADLAAWHALLLDAWRQHYFLRCYHPRQLLLLLPENNAVAGNGHGPSQGPACQALQWLRLAHSSASEAELKELQSCLARELSLRTAGGPGVRNDPAEYLRLVARCLAAALGKLPAAGLLDIPQGLREGAGVGVGLACLTGLPRSTAADASKLQEQGPSVPDTLPRIAGSITGGTAASGVAVLSLGPSQDVAGAVLALYGWAGHWPSTHHLLVCHAGTSWEEVDLLLLRCFHDPSYTREGGGQGSGISTPGAAPPARSHILGLSRVGRGGTQVGAAPSGTAGSAMPCPLYALVGVEELALELQARAVERVVALQQPRQEGGNGTSPGAGSSTRQALTIGGSDRPRLVLVFGGSMLVASGASDGDGGAGGDVRAQHSAYVAERAHALGYGVESLSLPPVTETRRYARSLLTWRYGERLSLVTSERAGLGKTRAIHDAARARNANVSTVHLSGPLSRAEAVRRLAVHGRAHPALPPEQDDLHLDVASLDPAGLAMLDRLLCELLVAGCVRDHDAVFMLESGRYVAVELANSFSDGLITGLTTLALLASRTHRRWDPDADLDVCVDNPFADLRVVCQYLAALDARTLDSREVDFAVAPALDRASCLRLLRKYIANDEGGCGQGDVAASFTSYSLLHAVVAVMAHGFKSMSKSVFFQVEMLKFMEAPPSLRSALARSILHTAKLFTLYCPRTPQNAQVAAQAARRGQQGSGGAEEVDLSVVMQVMGSLTRWEDCHYMLLLFNAADENTISALYRHPSHMPADMRLLLASQDTMHRNGQPGNWQPPDYGAMPQDQLMAVLYRLLSPVGDQGMPGKGEDRGGYVVTVDNVLKMALMYMRMRAGLPVLMMGETGCGKTSLVQRLAQVVGAPFEALCLHAGTTEWDIVECVRKGEAACEMMGGDCEALVFLDEINTCDHLGLVASILCHRRLQGRAIDPRVRLLAACNPYRLQRGAGTAAASGSAAGAEGVTAAGLPGKVRRGDALGRLEYRVHPLPDNLVQHVWDFGSLLPQHERAYVRAIVAHSWGRLIDPVTDLLMASHEFVRGVYGASACSLRDVRRWVLLATWFLSSLKRRQQQVRGQRSYLAPLGDMVTGLASYLFEPFGRKGGSYGRDGGTDLWSGGGGGPEGDAHGMDRWARHSPEVEAIILALAHCYLYRLNTRELRSRYLSALRGLIPRLSSTLQGGRGVTVSRLVMELVEAEQREYLNRMVLPPGTAKNRSLMETVFVMLVCILNRIPLFVVGRPGSGKSLAMHLIESNLRGADSADPFFRSLPGIVTVSYQGSEASTSEGISKAFDRAHALLGKAGAGEDVEMLPVVVLDEVGLAEVSRHNPLKVLHRLLEPPNQELPQVAVVGISNWALDASKMNRAVMLARPDPDTADLFDTAKAVWAAAAVSPGSAPGEGAPTEDLSVLSTVPDHVLQQLRAISQGYHDHYSGQAMSDFHGLRDFYALLRDLSGLSRSSSGASFASSLLQNPIDPPSLAFAVARHFGGLPLDAVARGQEVFHRRVFPNVPFHVLYQHSMPMGQTFGGGVDSWRMGAGPGTSQSAPTACVGAVPSVLRLLDANLGDPRARHLMLVTRGDAALGLLLAKAKLRHPVVICGSRFAADQSEHYLYRLLSRIILCMETGRVLVLRDVDSVYGALYDLLNQHYTVVAGRPLCRIALGANSNPLCAVHERFRCVVLLSRERVAQADPPFLNRFEKHLVTYESMLEQRPVAAEVLARLREWVAAACCLQREFDLPLGSGVLVAPAWSAGSRPTQRKEPSASFGPSDMFPGFDEDTLPSLVIHLASEGSGVEAPALKMLERCKQLLMGVAAVDGILRLSHSELARRNPSEARAWQQQALARGTQEGLRALLASRLAAQSGDVREQEGTGQATIGAPASQSSGAARGGLRLMVRTFARPTLNLSGTLQGLRGADGELVDVTVYKLGIFKSEAELTASLRQFWNASAPAGGQDVINTDGNAGTHTGAGNVLPLGQGLGASLLVLQVELDTEGEHLQLGMFLIEQMRDELLKQAPATAAAATATSGATAVADGTHACVGQAKHVCVVLHMRRRSMLPQQPVAAADAQTGAGPWPLNFLTAWEQASLDVLDARDAGDGTDMIPLLPNAPLLDVLTHSATSLLPRVIQQLLPWCLLCIRGRRTDASTSLPAGTGAGGGQAITAAGRTLVATAGVHRSWLDWVRSLSQNIASSPDLMAALTARIMSQLQQASTGGPQASLSATDASSHCSRSALPWQVATASDPRCLAGSSTFQGALRASLMDHVRSTLARLLFAVADASAFASVFPQGSFTARQAATQGAVRPLWAELLMDPQVVSVEGVPPPDGLECYRAVDDLPLAVPFASVLFQRLEARRGEYTARYRQIMAKLGGGGGAYPGASHDGQAVTGASDGDAWQELDACRAGLTRLAETSIPPALLRAARAFPTAYLEDMCCLHMSRIGMVGAKAARTGAFYRWLLQHASWGSLGHLAGAGADPVHLHVEVWERGAPLVRMASLLAAASIALPTEPEGLYPAWQQWQRAHARSGAMGAGWPHAAIGGRDVAGAMRSGTDLLRAFVEEFVACAVLPDSALLQRMMTPSGRDGSHDPAPQQPQAAGGVRVTSAGARGAAVASPTTAGSIPPLSRASLGPWMSLIENVIVKLGQLDRGGEGEEDTGDEGDDSQGQREASCTGAGSALHDSCHPAMLPVLVAFQEVARAMLASATTDADAGIMASFLEMGAQARALKEAFLRTPDACEKLLALLDGLRGRAPGKPATHVETHWPQGGHENDAATGGNQVAPAARHGDIIDASLWSLLSQCLATCRAAGEPAPYPVVKRIICERPPVTVTNLIHSLVDMAGPVDIVTMLADAETSGEGMVASHRQLSIIDNALMELGQQRWQRAGGMLCDVLSQGLVRGSQGPSQHEVAGLSHGSGQKNVASVSPPSTGQGQLADARHLRALRGALRVLLLSPPPWDQVANASGQGDAPLPAGTPHMPASPLLLVCAAALLRVLFPALAAALVPQWQQVAGASTNFRPQGGALQALGALDSSLVHRTSASGKASRPSSLTVQGEAILIFLFKCLRSHLPMDQVRALARALSANHGPLRVGQSLPWSDDSEERRTSPWGDPFPLAYVPAFTPTRATLASLVYSDVGMAEARPMMRAAASSCVSHMALGAALVERVYGLKALRPLTDREAWVVAWTRHQLLGRDPGDPPGTTRAAHGASNSGHSRCLLDWMLWTVTAYNHGRGDASDGDSSCTGGANAGGHGGQNHAALPSYCLPPHARKLVCAPDMARLEQQVAGWVAHLALVVSSCGTSNAPGGSGPCCGAHAAPSSGPEMPTGRQGVASPLHAYLCGSGGTPLSEQYILAAPSDERAAAINAVAEGAPARLGRYQCACGEVYFIGECTRPDQVGICPNCRNQIGGTRHNLLPNNDRVDGGPDASPENARVRAEDQKGVVLEDVSSLGNRFHTQRGLTPAGFRLLHAATQACLLVGHAAGLHAAMGGGSGGGRQGDAAHGDANLSAVLERAHGHVVNDMVRMAEAMDASTDNVLLLAHAVVARLGRALASGQLPTGALTTPELRSSWEVAFLDTCVRPVLDSPTAAREYVQSCQTRRPHVAGASGKPAGQGAAPAQRGCDDVSSDDGDADITLEGEIEGTAAPATADYANARLLHLLRVPPPLTLATLQTHVLGQGQGGVGAASFPVLRALVAPHGSPAGHLDVLPRMLLLRPLVAWTRFVCQEAGYQLTRERAKSLTLGEFIASFKDRYVAGTGDVMACGLKGVDKKNRAGI
eukprot:jgi/Mesvir1/4243/Mv22211-RA.1